jgi:hypothetical protein
VQGARCKTCRGLSQDAAKRKRRQVDSSCKEQARGEGLLSDDFKRPGELLSVW